MKNRMTIMLLTFLINCVNAQLDQIPPPAYDIPSSGNEAQNMSDRKLVLVKQLKKGLGIYWESKPINVRTSTETHSDEVKYGILKDSHVLLPDIFDIDLDLDDSYDESIDYIILTLVGNKGVYSLNQEKWVIPLLYEDVDQLSANVFKVRRSDGYFSVINIQDSQNECLWFESMDQQILDQPYYVVSSQNQYGIIDIYGKEVLPLKYNRVISSSFDEGAFIVREEKGKYGCIKILDGVSNEIIESKYNSIDKWGEFYIVNKDNKLGIFSKDGDEVLPTKYESVELVDSNLIKVSRKKFYQIFNLIGESIMDEKYKQIEAVVGRSHNGNKITYLKCSKANNNVILAMKNGKKLLEGDFDNILEVNGDLVVVQDDLKAGIYNLAKNNLVVDCEYDNIVGVAIEKFYGLKGNKVYMISLGDEMKISRVE